MNKSIISNDLFTYFFMYHPAFFVLKSDFGRYVSGSLIVQDVIRLYYVADIGEPSPSVIAG